MLAIIIITLSSLNTRLLAESAPKPILFMLDMFTLDALNLTSSGYYGNSVSIHRQKKPSPHLFATLFLGPKSGSVYTSNFMIFHNLSPHQPNHMHTHILSPNFRRINLALAAEMYLLYN